MDSAPLGKVLNEDNEIDEKFIKFRKREFIKKRDNSLHQVRKEGNPSRRDKILRKHQTVRKKRRPSS